MYIPRKYTFCKKHKRINNISNETQGNKPDFRQAMGGDQSKEFYDKFLLEMKKAHADDKIKNGVFGAMMDVSSFLQV